jgi:hypothetical protein
MAATNTDVYPLKSGGGVVVALERREPTVGSGGTRARYVLDRRGRAWRHRLRLKRPTGDVITMDLQVKQSAGYRLNKRADLAVYSVGAYGRALTESALVAAALYALALLEEADEEDLSDDVAALRAARLALSDLLQ